MEVLCHATDLISWALGLIREREVRVQSSDCGMPFSSETVSHDDDDDTFEWRRPDAVQPAETARDVGSSRSSGDVADMADVLLLRLLEDWAWDCEGDRDGDGIGDGDDDDDRTA